MNGMNTPHMNQKRKEEENAKINKRMEQTLPLNVTELCENVCVLKQQKPIENEWRIAKNTRKKNII